MWKCDDLAFPRVTAGMVSGIFFIAERDGAVAAVN
jgi:hypothetical protein